MNSKKTLKYHPRHQLECQIEGISYSKEIYELLVDWGETCASRIFKGIK